MAESSDLIPEVSPEVPECPEVQIERAINRTVRDFCNLTYYWQQAMQPITLLPFNPQSVSSYLYEIPLPDDTELLSVPELLYDQQPLLMKSVHWLNGQFYEWRNTTGRPTYYTLDVQRRVRFVPASVEVAPNIVTGQIALRPTREATTFSDVLLRYDSALVNGALSRLMLIPGKNWTNPNQAAVCQQIYQEGVSNARQEVLKQFSSGPETIRRRSWLYDYY